MKTKLFDFAEYENGILRGKHEEIKEAVNDFRKKAKECEYRAKNHNSTDAFYGAAKALNFVIEKLEQILNK